MATKSTVPTVANGDSWSASQQNTYLRDNIEALWPYTTAGDIAYASAANQLSRLAKPSVDSVLKHTIGGVPSWVALTHLKGTLHDVKMANFVPGGQVFSSTWADISGATVTLSLEVTCKVLVYASVTGYNGSGGRVFWVRAMVDGVGDSGNVPLNATLVSGARNEALPYFYTTGSVAAGSRIVKLQCQADTDPNYVERGRLMVAAYVQ